MLQNIFNTFFKTVQNIIIKRQIQHTICNNLLRIIVYLFYLLILFIYFKIFFYSIKKYSEIILLISKNIIIENQI